MGLFIVKKTFEIAGQHHLKLPYESKCRNSHGHNWIITVHCVATEEAVNENNGMVVDFTHIKKRVHDLLDHQDFNEVFAMLDRTGMNPTAENIARWICSRFGQCFRVDVQESSGNVATYIESTLYNQMLGA